MADQISNPEIAASISALIDKWWTRENQYLDWLNGTADGGPYADGRYPLTGKDGVTRYVSCPAALGASVSGLVGSASTYASAAAASATAAAASATDAETAQTAAETAATTATTEAGLASVSESNAANSEANASVYAGNAAASAAAALTSEANAATSETNAATSETNAATSETNAAASATSAAGSATSAAASAAAAASAVSGAIRFKGVWNASGGSYPSSPITGDLWQVSVAGTVSGVDYAVGDQIFYTGSGWDKIDNSDLVLSVAGRVGAVVLTSADVGLSNLSNFLQLVAANNLSDLTNVTTARTNLGVYSSSAVDSLLAAKAPLASPTFTGTVTLPGATITGTMAMNGDVYVTGKDFGGVARNLVGTDTTANKIVVGDANRGMVLKSLTSIQDSSGNTLPWVSASGTFTATLSATGSGSPTSVVDYMVLNGWVFLTIESALSSNTGTATSYKITGLPSNLFPSATRTLFTAIVDNNTTAPAKMTIASDGTWTLFPGVTASPGFSGTGLRGHNQLGTTYVYKL